MISAFITSPHLPPQAVVLSVAVWARSTAGAPTAAAAAALAEAMNRRRVICLLISSSSLSQSHVGAQADQALEREHDDQRQRDRHHRGGRNGAVEIEADVVEQDN